MILGASGMFGHTCYRHFSNNLNHEVIGVIRSSDCIALLPHGDCSRLVICEDVLNLDFLKKIICDSSPDVVINAAGIIKQSNLSACVQIMFELNSLFPKNLLQICSELNIRLIHLSTDCVFSGKRGMYRESDAPDPIDLYGRSKLFGEVYRSNAITIRTSIIGHEIRNKKSLLEWFLLQDKAMGYTNAIFSGLTTLELSSVILNKILPNNSLGGLYHISSNPISKYALLNLIAKEYNKKILLTESSEVKINRSLDSSKFREVTGYMPKDWQTMILQMREFG